MSKIIFTSRYIKGGKRGGNMVDYMATRDGIQIPSIINSSRSATENQQRLIAEVLRTVPEAAGLFEHEDYVQSPTIANASAFIGNAFEQHPELWSDVRNYVEYVAKRPGAERSKAAGHGLWNSSEQPIVLSKAIDEVANHKGNIWTHVVSLRREDAERMGYTSAVEWRNLVLEKMPTVADAMKIPKEKLRWYAAYHDKDTNPHIHLLVYSADPTFGYLTEPSIEKMRSAFAGSIYKNDLLHIYERKDLARSQVNQFAEERLQVLAESLNGADFLLADMLARLGSDLKQSKGKKQYGYLKPALKTQVDEIVRQLAADPRIAEMYGHWCELGADVKRIYTGKPDEPPPLEHEKTFRTIKNMVIRQAMEMPEQVSVPPDFPEPEMPDDVELEDTTDGDELLEAEPLEYSVSWSEEYKLARRYLFGQGRDFPEAHALFLLEAESGNALALHDLGYMHQHGLGVEESMEEAQVWYGKAYRAFCAAEQEKSSPYLQYRIGKLHRDGYGTVQDYEQAALWFERAADEGNQYAQYSLGGLYQRGLGVEQSDEIVFRLFSLSAGRGNAYAAYALAGMHEQGFATEVDADAAQQCYRIAFGKFESMESKGADDKLQYCLGKMLLDGRGVEEDVPRAAAYLEKAAENKNAHAQYRLGKLLLLGRNVEPDRERAVAYLTASAAQGNEYAQWFLDHMDDGIHNAALSLLRNLANMIAQDYSQQRQRYEQAVDRKLMAKIRRKKQELGQKFE